MHSMPASQHPNKFDSVTFRIRKNNISSIVTIQLTWHGFSIITRLARLGWSFSEIAR